MHPHAQALQALRLPFDAGTLCWPAAGAVFLQAQPGWPWPGFAAVQPYRPAMDALQREGRAATCDDGAAAHNAGADAPLVLLLPPRQREQARALMAHAFDRCAPGGIVVASVANDAGAKSSEADLRRIAPLDGSIAKHHCRVFWARKDPAHIDHALVGAWRALDAPRRIAAPQLPGGGFVSRPGVFAWDRIDPASALLASVLPHDLAGEGADLGAGWGYLALSVLRRAPRIDALDLYEADARALALARGNLAAHGAQARTEFFWHDVTTGLPRGYDFVLTNPPFHATDRADRPELGQCFIEVAADALRPGGRLYLVANRHLPYEAALSARFSAVRVLAQAQGFKAIEAVRGASG